MEFPQQFVVDVVVGFGGGGAVASVAHVFGGNVRVEVGDEVAFPVFFVKIAVGGKFVNE